jgi:hypothetical protein
MFCRVELMQGKTDRFAVNSEAKKSWAAHKDAGKFASICLTINCILI